MNTIELSPVANHVIAPERFKADLREIETRGFVVIRNFLSLQEIDIIKKDYLIQRDRSDNANYSVAFAGAEVYELLSEKILKVGEEVGKVTSTHTDFDQGALYFSIKGVKFSWHQDHECFFMNQNHIDYLNFYMVIIKEKVEEANLHVIPFDKLKAKSPEYYDMVVGSGARWYTVRDGVTHIYSDEVGASVGTIPFDIATIAETPHLNAGDLLLLRGDIIHSSQESNTNRIALSFRLAYSRTKVSLKKLVNGGKPKMVIMIRNKSNYNRIFDAFKKLNATVATNAELKSKIDLHSPAPSKLRFILRIMGLRLRFMFTD